MTYEELERKAFAYWLRTGIKIDINNYLGEIKSSSGLQELDFLKEVEFGKTLFVGEGNFSFALSVATYSKAFRSHLIATSYETEKEISEERNKNIKELSKLGAKTMLGIDCTKLEDHFKDLKFNRIIFNFPNTASRESYYNKTENHYLLKNFLKSSINILKPNGKVIISIVDTPYYKGSFGIEDLKLKEYKEPLAYKFNPDRYKGYNHTMTHKDENALEKYDNFISLVFILK